MPSMVAAVELQFDPALKVRRVTYGPSSRPMPEKARCTTLSRAFAASRASQRMWTHLNLAGALELTSRREKVASVASHRFVDNWL